MQVKEGNSNVLIVGLGNPGSEFEQTRHNTGFDFLDSFASQNNTKIDKSKLSSLLGNIKKNGTTIYLCKPQSYMNNSGKSVRSIKDFYKIESTKIIVVFDDLDLEVGQIKIKRGGSSAGHNGIKSMIEHLPGNDFIRIRVGIGKPSAKSMTNKYVLSKLKNDDLKIINKINNLADKIIISIVFKGISFAMNTFNSKIQ